MIAVILVDRARWVKGEKGFETDTDHGSFLYIMLNPLCPSQAWGMDSCGSASAGPDAIE